MAEEKDNSQPSLIPPHGGYRELKSYQNAEIVYDGTVKFCDRFIDRRSRTLPVTGRREQLRQPRAHLRRGACGRSGLWQC